MRAHRSRERCVQLPVVQRTLGCRRPDQRADRFQQAREGEREPAKSGWCVATEGGKPWRGPSPRRHRLSRSGLSPVCWVGLLQCAQALEGRGRARAQSDGLRTGSPSGSAFTNPMRVAAFERTYGTAEGAKPRRVNPIGGTGMKQARQVAGGARRREGAKP
jgi:hypothetical protein